MKILIVEDNRVQNEVLANFLRRDGYDVISTYTIAEARQNFDGEVSLIILDVMLPDGSGLDFLGEIRTHSDVPVIVLTALGDEFTQVSTFDLKADEYVEKPVSPVVMTKRVKVLLGRIYGDKNVVSIMGYKFDFEKFTVYDANGNEVKLTTKEIQIVKCLYEANGGVVTRDGILNCAWGYEFIGDDRQVDTHIKNIRKKLTPEIILTVKGVGYRLNV